MSLRWYFLLRRWLTISSPSPPHPILTRTLQILPRLKLRGLPHPPLLPFEIPQRLIDTFQAHDFQTESFGSEFVEGAEADGEGEAEDEKFADCVAGLVFGARGDEVVGDAGGHLDV